MALPRAATGATAAVPAGDDTTIENPKRALWTVFLIVFIDLLGFGVIIPILPFYVRSFGVSDLFIGLLAASYSIAQFVAAPTLGRISDSRGRRPVLMLSLFGATIAWVIFGLAGQIDVLFGTTAAITTLFLARLVAGAMGGNIAAAQAYIADITAPKERAGALGLIGAAFGLGFIFGPAIGGFFASEAVVSTADTLLPDVIPTTPYSLPSFAAAALSLLSLLCAAMFLEEPDRDRSNDTSETLVGQFVSALHNERLRGLVVAFFLLSVAFSGVQVMFIPFAADSYGYTAAQTALLLSYIGVLGVLNQGIIVGKLAKRISPLRIAVIGGTSLALALATLPLAPLASGEFARLNSIAPWFTPELIALLVVLAGLSFGNGLLNVALSTLVSLSSSAERQGTAFGVTQGAGSLGRTIGPPLMAFLYAFVAGWTPFVFGAVLLIPTLIAVIAGTSREQTGLS
ncbi:MFS transporter [Halorubraceae archaeon YAN]|nr:MFS transporter [Halorubraceae archaeon YAN]